MEMISVGILIMWLGVASMIARLLARNSYPAAANAIALAGAGFVATVTLLFFLFKPMLPAGIPATWILQPLAIASGIAALVVALVSFLLIKQTRRRRAAA